MGSKRQIGLGAASLLGAVLCLTGDCLGAQSAKLLVDIRAKGGSSPSQIVSVLGRLYFKADDGAKGWDLWTSDGTAQGTTRVPYFKVPAGPARIGRIERLGKRVLFTRSVAVGQNPPIWSTYLLISDGTAAGTMTLTALFFGSAPVLDHDLFRWKDKIYFRANYGSLGEELWVTDGTVQGTKLLKDLYSGVFGSGPRHFSALRDKMVFSAAGPSGVELYESDGTAAGTRLLKDIDPRKGFSGRPEGLVAWRGRVYFSAEGATGGRELWVTDGTAVGTRQLKDLRVIGSSAPGGLTALGDRLVFSADDGVRGRELWESDGTAVGTRLLKDVAAGSASSNPGQISPLGSRRFYFAADDRTGKGTELMVSDGTAAGTRLLQDISPGGASSWPQNGGRSFAHMGGKLYLGADDGTRGSELWVLDPASAVTQRVGMACGGLHAQATDAVMGLKNGLKIHASGLRPNHVGMLVLGTPARFAFYGGPCELHFDVLRPWFIMDVVATGNKLTHDVAFTMPAHPAFVGARFVFQFFELDPGPKGPAMRSGHALELTLHPK